MERDCVIPGRSRRRSRSGIWVACLAIMTAWCATTGVIATAEPTTAGVVLVNLADATVVDTWTTVNDPVMGGRSVSTVAFGGGGLVFSGDISLENNGGFASARSPIDPEIGRRATGARTLGVRATGDGKTYLLKAESAGLPWSYVQRFTTEAGVARTYALPVSGFEAVGRFLNPAPEAPQNLDPSTISRISLYILDKQQGPFQLTVNAIVASV